MAEVSPAQSTLKRLIEAENDAREILKTASENADATIAKAREEAKESVDVVQQEAANLLRSRLEAAECHAAIEMKQRLDQAETEAQEFERLAKINSARAVDVVVEWVTFKDK
jgi:vacuolar-type H+-ATPase subunit H